jgi:thiol-disulfide isomerase/thioredoxin
MRILNTPMVCLSLVAFGLMGDLAFGQEWAESYRKDYKPEHGTPQERLKRDVKRSLGQPAPTLVFQNIRTGRWDTLSSLRGKVVLLNSWSTACSPCVGEMPDLSRLQTQYGDRGLVVLTVSSQDKGTVSEFLDRTKIKVGGIDAVVPWTNLVWPFQATFNPSGYIIDRNGLVRAFLTGQKSYETLRKTILPFVRRRHRHH